MKVVVMMIIKDDARAQSTTNCCQLSLVKTDIQYILRINYTAQQSADDDDFISRVCSLASI
jgi:hypothetical protein